MAQLTDASTSALFDLLYELEPKERNLAGDVIGDYSFDRPLKSGDRLVFCDMALYTMVKNLTA